MGGDCLVSLISVVNPLIKMIWFAFKFIIFNKAKQPEIKLFYFDFDPIRIFLVTKTAL